MEFTLLETAVIAVIALIVGFKVNGIWMALTFKEILKDLGVTEKDLRKLAGEKDIPLKQMSSEETTELTPVEVRIEQHNGVLYAYRVADDQFLGQGADRDKLIESLTHNLTNVRVIVDKDQGADYLIKP